MVAQAFAGILTKAFYGLPVEQTAMAEATIPDLSSGSPGPQDDDPGPAEPVSTLVTRGGRRNGRPSVFDVRLIFQR
jgi:hypothetical protein